jgi:hypothetical protein
MSKTKRKPLHIPLSKHIPKDILSSSNYGASKNLLGINSMSVPQSRLPEFKGYYYSPNISPMKPGLNQLRQYTEQPNHGKCLDIHDEGPQNKPG